MQNYFDIQQENGTMTIGSATHLTERENEVLQMPSDLSLEAVVDISGALRHLLADVFGLLREDEEFSLA